MVLISMASDFFGYQLGLLEIPTLHMYQELDLFELSDVELILDCLGLESGDCNRISAVFIPLLT